MTKIVKYYFDKWWIPLIFALSTGLVFIISLYFDSLQFENVSFFVLLLGWISLIISAIYQFGKKRWTQGIITGVCFIGIFTGFLFYSIATFFIDQSQPDEFANNLIIPNDIKIENPADPYKDNLALDSILEIKKTSIDLLLYNSFQPGIYEYDIWIRKIERGKIYLKAFEVTNNTRLSAHRLKERSTMSVYNPTDRLIRLGSDDDFTIYEGDWGEPYAARFEVWYIPDDGTKETKLFEKNFKIEGWMR